MKKILNKISKKINDFFDVIKYKRKANTAINMYHARNEEYIEALKTMPILVNQILDLQNQVKKLKDERKELKAEIEERLKRKKRKG